MERYGHKYLYIALRLRACISNALQRMGWSSHWTCDRLRASNHHARAQIPKRADARSCVPCSLIQQCMIELVTFICIWWTPPMLNLCRGTPHVCISYRLSWEECPIPASVRSILYLCADAGGRPPRPLTDFLRIACTCVDWSSCSSASHPPRPSNTFGHSIP